MFFITAIISFLILNNILRPKGIEYEEPVEKVLFDFTTNGTADDWVEQSDTVRDVGMSKAVFTMQRTKIFERAVLFTLLNPQINGACFAGARSMKHFNLEKFRYIAIRIRAQGKNRRYKLVLRHKNLNNEPHVTYEAYFNVPVNQFYVAKVPFTDFKAYYRGKKVEDADPLDKSNITSVGIQIAGGVYLPQKQSGVASLEIEWIRAVT